MLKVFVVLVSVFLFSNIASARLCIANNFFEEDGWDTHTRQDFAAVSKNVMAYYEQNKQNFVSDLELEFYSEEHEAMVGLKSFDDLRTSNDEMLGDLVLITAPKTGELMEVRWYADKIKHIIYNHSLQECASELIPDVENAIF